MSSYLIAIPARYASSRFPGKALALVGGEPMIARVCRQARRTAARRVIVCTDHEEIAAAAAVAGAEVCMTPSQLPSGTDRIGCMLREFGLGGEELVVNIQGDEPLIRPGHIDLVAAALESHPGAAMASLCAPMHSLADVMDPHIVKVVLDREGYALYFSRAPIPYERDYFAAGGGDGGGELRFTHYHHFGLYAYRAQTVLDFIAAGPCELERCEMLEQLRVLHRGGRIIMAVTDEPPQPGIDTPEDLRRANAYLQAAGGDG